MKDPTPQMRTWRLSGSESHTGLRARMQWPQVQTQPPAKSNYSHWTQDCHFHSTCEDTHNRRITAHVRTHTTTESHVVGTPGPAHTCICVCTHPHENVCAPVAMCVCRSTQTHVSTRTTAESWTCVSTHTTTESQTHVSTCTTAESRTRMSTHTTAESWTHIAGRHGLAHVDVYACGHVHTGMFMHPLPCRFACVGRH